MPFRYIVRGHVQGVGFRAFVNSVAGIVGASGEVWNRRDGAVEVISSVAIEDKLHKGPGHVDTVDAFDHPFELTGPFKIGPTR